MNSLVVALCALLGFSSGSELRATFAPSGLEGRLDDGVDPGDPLFLTPLIQAGQIDEAREQSRVTGLPTAEGHDLPGGYSGYLTVNQTYNSNLFFWYFPAQVPDPTDAPVLLWLQGGPGGSSLFGLFVEHGPFLVTKEQHLKPRLFAWTNKYHVLYVDQPVGTGFSFTDHDEGYARNEEDVAADLYEALLQFFTLFPDLQQSDFYVTGESYAGKYVPAISHKLHVEGPEIIQFKGMAIGDGLIDPINMFDYGDFLYQLGLLDENQRQYFMDQQDKARSFIRQQDWRQAFLVFDTLLNGDTITVPSAFKNFTGMNQYFNLRYTNPPVDQDYYNAYVVSNPVRKSIHVGNLPYNNGSIVEDHLIEDMMQSTAPLVSEIMDNYKVLIYSGQMDIIIAYPLTANFLWNLEWSGSQAYRAAERSIWKVAACDQEVAGYVRQVGQFYQVLLRNAGHMVPYDQPRAAFDMISRFVEGKPFA